MNNFVQAFILEDIAATILLSGILPYMKIHQIYTHNSLRNFTYILSLADQTAIVIDPWDAEVINQQLDSLELSLAVIINTHEHWDHTQGNQPLVDQHACQVWAHQNGQGKIPGLTRALVANETILLDPNHQLLVLDTPGHTFAHLCFIVKKNNIAQCVFTGDTLFNAGVGHCRGGGDEATLYQTISQHFQHLDDEIIVYPGHDYLQNNLAFTVQHEPSNQTAKNWLNKVEASDYSPGSIQTTIANEKNFNTFLRLDNQEIINNLGLKEPKPQEVFFALRALRDSW